MRHANRRPPPRTTSEEVPQDSRSRPPERGRSRYDPDPAQGGAHELEAAITDELAWTPSVDAREIGVTVTDGAATLSGNVGTYPELEEALRAAPVSTASP